MVTAIMDRKIIMVSDSLKRDDRYSEDKNVNKMS